MDLIAHVSTSLFPPRSITVAASAYLKPVPAGPARATCSARMRAWQDVLSFRSPAAVLLVHPRASAPPSRRRAALHSPFSGFHAPAPARMPILRFALRRCLACLLAALVACLPLCQAPPSQHAVCGCASTQASFTRCAHRAQPRAPCRGAGASKASSCPAACVRGGPKPLKAPAAYRSNAPTRTAAPGECSATRTLHRAPGSLSLDNVRSNTPHSTSEGGARSRPRLRWPADQCVHPSCCIRCFPHVSIPLWPPGGTPHPTWARTSAPRKAAKGLRGTTA